jgi:hypothetical protein
MLHFTTKKAAGLAAVIAAASLAVAAPAKAGNNPSITITPVFCSTFTWQILPQFGILAADRYSYYGESQRVWVRSQVWSRTTQTWSPASHWYYGTATDTSGPQTWTDATTGQVTGNGNWTPITWNISQPGSYQVTLQFAWDQGSSDGPAGSTNALLEPGICTF